MLLNLATLMELNEHYYFNTVFYLKYENPDLLGQVNHGKRYLNGIKALKHIALLVKISITKKCFSLVVLKFTLCHFEILNTTCVSD